MPKFEYDMIVLGGGAAGLTTTAGAAQLGVKVLLIEKEPLLGGDCLHYGCVPSKTLIKSAKVYHSMQHAKHYGLPQPNIPPVDYRHIAARIQSVKDVIQQHDSVERFEGLGAEVLFGNASFADEHTVVVESDKGIRRITGKQIVIATGSSPSAPPFTGLDNIPYLTNMDVFTLEKLPESLAVLGGGPIAVEMAQSFHRLGCKVTIIQRSGQILSKEDPDMANIVLENLRSDGMEILLSATVQEIRKTTNGVAVALTRGENEHRVVEAEQLLVALGRSPNIDSLHLGEAGIMFDGKGIHVDERMRTNQTHIFACGDVTGTHQFTHAAGYEGGIVVSNAVFHLPRKANYTWLPWATYTDPELASIGMNEKAAKAKGVAYTVRTEKFSANDRALAEGQPQGQIKMLLNNKEKPLGVQIVGPNAGELINEWVAILNGKIKLSTLAGAIHPYPTLGEINKRVAGSLIGEKIFSNKVRTGLCFLFGYQGKACQKNK